MRVNAQIKTRKNRLARLITHRDLFQAQQRRGHGFCRGLKHERGDMFIDNGGDGLQPGKGFEAALRLARLVGLGAETVDIGFHVTARIVLLFLQAQLQRLFLAPQRLEAVIGAGGVIEFAVLQMQNALHRGIEQIAVMADHHHRTRIRAQIGGDPQGAFQIKIVGRLIEQQQIRLGKKQRGERHAHAPAAGKLR